MGSAEADGFAIPNAKLLFSPHTWVFPGPGPATGALATRFEAVVARAVGSGGAEFAISVRSPGTTGLVVDGLVGEFGGLVEEPIVVDGPNEEVPLDGVTADVEEERLAIVVDAEIAVVVDAMDMLVVVVPDVGGTVELLETGISLLVVADCPCPDVGISTASMAAAATMDPNLPPIAVLIEVFTIAPIRCYSANHNYGQDSAATVHIG